jgi:formamidopyrimidine-DNA glycosylase
MRHAFSLDDGRELRFIDGRKFGKLWLADDPGDVLPPLGPEPLGDEFTPETLAQRFRGRNAPVKALLLEQSIVAGMGNLYADESLFLAGIHPLRPASELSTEEVSRLKHAIVSALTAAVRKYDEVRDECWPDPPTAFSAWSIPRKSGVSCPRCGHLVDAIRVSGRGTWFCPGCQG